MSNQVDVVQNEQSNFNLSCVACVYGRVSGFCFVYVLTRASFVVLTNYFLNINQVSTTVSINTVDHFH